MLSARTEECLSRLGCDQLLNGELEDGPAHQAHRAGCGWCLALIAEHRRERADFTVPPRWRARRSRAPWLVAAALAAGLTAWLTVPRPDETRTKGGPVLGFYLKRGDSIRRGASGEQVAPGDALDFTATSATPAYLAIISVDGARHVSVYYPRGPITAAVAPGEQLLPLSVRLDDVRGLERVHGVFCERPAAVAAVAQAVIDGVTPAGCVIDTLTLEKR